MVKRDTVTPNAIDDEQFVLKEGQMSEDNPPTPGSDEAIDLGCLCPILDNAHGNGYMNAKDKDGKPVFVIVESCPLHGWNKKQEVGP